MAIETVQYKECTCDVCGAKEVVPTSLIAPKNWWKLHFSKEGLTYISLDLCENCYTTISNSVDRMRNEEGTPC